MVQGGGPASGLGYWRCASHGGARSRTMIRVERGDVRGFVGNVKGELWGGVELGLSG
jgi:hypothetical protein